MAKVSPLNLVEQHVEKGVLVVSGLVFLFVLAHWGLSSPRRIEIVAGAGGTTEEVSPGEADEKLREVAAEIRRLHQQAEPESAQYGNLAERVKRYRHPLFGDFYPGVALSQPKKWDELPMMEEREVRVDLEALTEALVAPEAPQMNVNRVLPEKSDIEETWVAHVASVYPWGQVADQWGQLLGGTRAQSRMVVLAVEAEVQIRRPDGQWGEPEQVRSVAASARDGDGGSWEPEQLPEYDGTNAREVRDAINTYIRSRMTRVMEPDYWPIYRPSARRWVNWRVNLPETRVSRMADETGETQESRMTGDMRRRPTETDVNRTEGDDDTPAPTPVPPLSEQMDNGSVLVWVHDEGLQSNRDYRYRVRLRLLNPLYTWEQYVEDPDEARRASVYTPFSEWSEEVTVPRDVQFFLTGALPGRQDQGTSGRIVVTVFKHSRGQVVRSRFTLRRGDAIGGSEQVTVVDPIEEQEQEVTVDFSTGAVVIDFDFDKQVEAPGMSRRTVEMIYLDELGRLRSRIMLRDRDSEAYQRLRGRAEQAGAEAPESRDDGSYEDRRDRGRDWERYEREMPRRREDDRYRYRQ